MLPYIKEVDVEKILDEERIFVIVEKYNDVKATIEKELDLDSLEDFSKKIKITRARLEALYEYAKIFKNIYQDLKKERVALDFSDLEEYTLKLLENPTIAKEIQDKYKYVFIDEYQDTNMVQEEIVRKVAKDNNLFTLVKIKLLSKPAL